MDTLTWEALVAFITDIYNFVIAIFNKEVPEAKELWEKYVG